MQQFATSIEYASNSPMSDLATKSRPGSCLSMRVFWASSGCRTSSESKPRKVATLAPEVLSTSDCIDFARGSAAADDAVACACKPRCKMQTNQEWDEAGVVVDPPKHHSRPPYPFYSDKFWSLSQWSSTHKQLLSTRCRAKGDKLCM